MSKHAAEPVLTNSVYDKLRAVAQYWVPALGALYFGLAQIWHLPYPEEVVGTLVVIDTFLGVILGYSKAKYDKSDAAYDGSLVVSTPDEERLLFSIEPDVPLIEVPDKKKLVLKVTKTP